MMLKIKVSKNTPELNYTLDVVFKEFLGLEFQVKEQDIKQIEIELSDGHQLKINAEFFDKDADGYLTEDALPKVTYSKNNGFYSEEDLPILYGEDGLEISEKSINCDIDIFGAIFFMLSRMEEAIIKERDQHDRFAATSSIAYKYGFLDRPIVDEYVEFLWNMLSKLDANLVRKERQFKKIISCDVDWPFEPAKYSLKETLKKSIKSLLYRGGLVNSIVFIKQYVYRALNLKQTDEYHDNLQWMMSINEKVENQLEFYFIPSNTSSKDNNFNIEDEKHLKLFKSIYGRGHKVGIHPGYNCFKSESNFKSSYQKLLSTMDKANISQDVWGGRMHYLRWNILKTPQIWESLGLSYDSTLGFADRAGFRCGTCHVFSMFDLNKKVKMSLKQIPLINMECTIIDKKYEGLGYNEKSFERFLYFKSVVQKYNGNYTLLWHNSYFDHEKSKDFYRRLIS